MSCSYSVVSNVYGVKLRRRPTRDSAYRHCEKLLPFCLKSWQRSSEYIEGGKCNYPLCKSVLIWTLGLLSLCQCTETWIVAVSTSFCCSHCRPCRHQLRAQVLCLICLSNSFWCCLFSLQCLVCVLFKLAIRFKSCIHTTSSCSYF